ncbi:telomeric repeat-binding factor 2-interacting protein 1 isoform X2 [Danio aesculapii]|uniref:telomeric repeat-binding factor 2-interacting protein 1 isoform X2 n=1 Tax=Danio aesculapii TaxID=1142201 RepID=UPI0024BF803E|nr:telomeric repeat-binding factor 2-interacting protein 1 isoform X2 [Danio aesculapii]
MPKKEEVSKISPVLFLDPGGQSMRFFVRPGPTKMQLHPLITSGGGNLCRNQEPGAILLIDPTDATNATPNTGQKYISTKYIRDCVEQNQQLDPKDYAITIGPSVQTRMALRNQGSGRLGYSLEDDAAILKFIEKRQQDAKGNLVWKEMEKRRVTEHSWQSMKDRFLKHLQQKLADKTTKKSPLKRKPLSFVQSPLRKKKVVEISEDESVQEADCPEATMATETVSIHPPASPERASSPPEEPQAAGEPSQTSSNDSQDETCVLVLETPETENPRLEEDAPNEPNKHSSLKKKRHKASKTSTTDSRSSRLEEDPDGQHIPDANEHSSPKKKKQKACKNSTTDSRSSRLEEDPDEQHIPDESNEQSSPNKTRQITSKSSTSDSRNPRGDQGSNAISSPSKTRPTNSKASTPDSKKLGILAKAAKEFEDSDVMDESEECENPCEVPIAEPSDAQESSATPATLAKEPEGQAESHEETQPDSPMSEEERPGPSSTVVQPSLNSSINCSQIRATPEETLSRDLLEVKEQVINLMRETKKDLVEVTKALLKASGDFKRARVYLVNGYDHETHGPLWTRLDDETLLVADPYELEQLQSKFGEEEVTRRKSFLTTDVK